MQADPSLSPFRAATLVSPTASFHRLPIQSWGRQTLPTVKLKVFKELKDPTQVLLNLKQYHVAMKSVFDSQFPDGIAVRRDFAKGDSPY
ncbi:MAG: hypothetical protein ABJB61_15095 [bacterium]